MLCAAPTVIPFGKTVAKLACNKEVALPPFEYPSELTVLTNFGVICGATLSRTVIVWIALAVLPQSSVAIHVREMMFVPLAPLAASLKVIVTDPQLSWAVALPVEFVEVSVDGHSSETSAGTVSVGLVVS